MYAGLLPIESGSLRHSNVSFGKRPHLVDNARTDGVGGLITAMANRFTIARGLAERAVNLAFVKLGIAPPPCRTATTPLLGGAFASTHALVTGARASNAPGLTPDRAERLARTYGSSWIEVARLIAADPCLSEPLGATPTLKAEIVHALRQEMAGTLADCVFTRTELGTAGHPGDAALTACAALAAEELGWSVERTEAELTEVRSRFPAA